MGFHPPDGVRVILDDDDEFSEALEALEGSGTPNESGFWTKCSCQHNWVEHGSEEGDIRRRLSVAMRLDQMLVEQDKLADFAYTDNDVELLRKCILLFAKSGPGSLTFEAVQTDVSIPG